MNIFKSFTFSQFFRLILILSIFVVGISSGQNPLTPGQPNAQPQMPPDPELEKSILEYERLLKKYPDKKDLNYNMGNLKYVLGDMENAVSEYQKSLEMENDLVKSHAYYNMGNAYAQQGNLEEAVAHFQKALEYNGSDDDLKYNYEMSKMMLQQQEQEQQQQQGDEDQENDDQEQEQEQQQQQQDQSGEKEESQDESESEKSENEEEPDEQNKPEESQGEEEKTEEESQPQPQNPEEAAEKKLEKDEAEAILNALKADEKNMMKKIYKSGKKVKVEKDW